MTEKGISRIKKILVTFIAITCLILIACIGVAAKTETYTFKVEVGTGLSDVVSLYMPKKGRISDTFGSCPTIFDGYKKSENKAQAINDTDGTKSKWKNFVLNTDGGPLTVAYGNSLSKGNYRIKYKNIGKGGFRATTTLSLTY